MTEDAKSIISFAKDAVAEGLAAQLVESFGHQTVRRLAGSIVLFARFGGTEIPLSVTVDSAELAVVADELLRKSQFFSVMLQRQGHWITLREGPVSRDLYRSFVKAVESYWFPNADDSGQQREGLDSNATMIDRASDMTLQCHPDIEEFIHYDKFQTRGRLIERIELRMEGDVSEAVNWFLTVLCTYESGRPIWQGIDFAYWLPCTQVMLAESSVLGEFFEVSSGRVRIRAGCDLARLESVARCVRANWRPTIHAR